ncbi:hypothetical protein ACEPPN_017244 [Leptodophora sp. 'Broadleaf-Isolate-01']
MSTPESSTRVISRQERLRMKRHLRQQKSKPFRFLDLPREIRDRIYELWLERPVGIAPTFTCPRRKRKEPRYKTAAASEEQRLEKYTLSKYHWDNQRKLLPGTSTDDLNPVNDKTERVTVTWTSAPTDQQSEVLAKGIQAELPLEHVYDLPDTKIYDKGICCSIIKHFANKRSDGSFEIINKEERYVPRLYGSGILSANKQTNNEAVQILYRRNTFVFNTAGVHSSFALSITRHLVPVPGFPTSQGNLPTEQEITQSVDMIFTDRFPKSEFLIYDPLTVFLRTIGRYNTSLIRSIKINGFFKTCSNLQPTLIENFTWELYEAKCGKLDLSAIMPIYIHVLSRVCGDLRNLTLHQTWGTNESRSVQFEGDWRWSTSSFRNIPDDGENDSKYSEEVERVAKGLPKLRRLQLGNYDSHQADPAGDLVQDEWGSSIKWTDFVAKREEERFIEGLRILKIGQRVSRTVSPERVFGENKRGWLLKTGKCNVGQEVRGPDENAVNKSTPGDIEDVEEALSLGLVDSTSENKKGCEKSKSRQGGKGRALSHSSGSTNPFAMLMDDVDSQDE